MEKRTDLSATSTWIHEQLVNRLDQSAWTPDMAQGLSRLRLATQRRARRTRTVWISTAAIAASAVALGLSVPVTRVYAQKCLDACLAGTGLATQSVLASLRSTEGARPQAPQFSLVDNTGKPIQLAALKGRVVVLNFWATWCPPCREEIPWLDELHRDLQTQGLSVIGVSVDEGGWAAVRPFLASHAVNYPIALASPSFLKSYSEVRALPTTIAIDRQGRIAFTHTGLLGKKSHRDQIEALLHE